MIYFEGQTIFENVTPLSDYNSFNMLVVELTICNMKYKCNLIERQYCMVKCNVK